MADLERELAHKQPARVLTASTYRSSTAPELMTAPHHGRRRLMETARREQAAGRIDVLAARPVWRDDVGRWELPVRRLYSAPRPWWRARWFATLAVLAVLGNLLGLLWWVLTSLAALPLLLFMAGAFAGLLVLVRAGRRSSVRVTQIVEVKR